jgi:glyoxylate reductase
MRVLITRQIPEPAERLLTEAGCDVDRPEDDAAMPRSELLARVPGASGLLATLSDRIDHELLDAAGPTLRVVANFAVGYENIDIEACRRRGVRVTNTPEVLTDATADLTWALILAAARRLGEGERMIRAGAWTGWAPSQLLGEHITGATLGIVGAGRIGTAVGLRAAGFRMRVLYAHPRPSETLERTVRARRVELDRLLAEADIVTLHVPMRPSNRHLIGAPQLASMKSTAILINTSRGPLIDEGALVDALRTRRIAAAGLDVYEDEPRLARGLADLPNVVLAPHLGSATRATREQMSRTAAENLIAVLSGREPPNAVV